MKLLAKLFARNGSPKDRAVALVLWGLVLTTLFVGVGLLGRRSSRAADDSSDRKGFETSLNQAHEVSGFVGSFGPRIEEAEKRLRTKDGELEELRAKVRSQESHLLALLEAVRSLGAAAPSGGSAPRDSEPLARLQKFSVSTSSSGKAATVRIPAGSFGEGTLLTGVYAPTDGVALPVQIRLDQVLVGPNRTRVPIQGAFLIGKAVGDANSIRAVIQVSKLSFVRADGKSVEVPVNGYVAGDDGVQGLAGTYVWRIQEAAAVSATSGGLSAAAEAVGAKEVTNQMNPLGGSSQILTGDLGRLAATRGASEAALEIQKIVAKRLEEITPAIYIPNGRRLTVLFLDGVDLPGVGTTDLQNEFTRNPYAGLDFDR